MVEPRFVEHQESSLEVLEKPQSLEADARWISHEGLRHLLKERHLEGTAEDEAEIRREAASEEYRTSKEGRAAAAFEESLRHNPLQFVRPIEDDISKQLGAQFAEKVVREIAYNGKSEDYATVARVARGLVNPDWTIETVSEQDLKPEQLKEAAIRAEMLWALNLEKYADPFVSGGKSPLNLEGLQLVSRLILKSRNEAVTPENIQRIVAEKLREHADALTFWQGALEALGERYPDRGPKFAEALGASGIDLEFDGAGYKLKEELRKERPAGDHENFERGMYEGRRLYETKYGAPQKLEEAKDLTHLSMEKLEKENALHALVLQIDELTARRQSLFLRKEEARIARRGFGGMVRSLFSSGNKEEVTKELDAEYIATVARLVELAKERERLEKEYEDLKKELEKTTIH